MAQIEYGVSVSVIACRNYKITPQEVIEAVLSELQIKRFRLMSYWSEIEMQADAYDFSELDAQIEQIEAAGGSVTLCLGMRQPRWPECHVPEWAKELSAQARNQKLFEFIERTVRRYKHNKTVESYQLENEALNRGIGTCEDYSRRRLREEYQLLKNLDPDRPVVMTTSNSWGLPMRRPIPDIIGFSYYLYEWGDGKPTHKPLPWWVHSVRKFGGKLYGKPVICHELQAEPWGPVGNELLSEEQQRELMDAKRLEKHIQYAQKTGIKTIDLWGVEWWYWRKVKHEDASLWGVIANL